jgi:hypothetical protein
VTVKRIRHLRPAASTELRSPLPIHSSHSRSLPLRHLQARRSAPPLPQHLAQVRPRPFRSLPRPRSLLAPGKALTALKAADCPNPIVAGRSARIERADTATGLMMLAGDFASNGEAPRLGAPTEDLFVLGFAGRAAASTATFTGDEARPVVTAAVDKGASGGPVFDRSGALVGVVAPIAGEPDRARTFEGLPLGACPSSGGIFVTNLIPFEA